MMNTLENLKQTAGEDWHNWKWQIQNRIQTIEELAQYIPISEEEKEIFAQAKSFFKFATTPYYLSLVQPNNPHDPIRRQLVPSRSELQSSKYEVSDPLSEENHMPVRGLTHRYPDRALWYLSHQCAVYCRFCTRKRKVGNSEQTPKREDWENALHYIRKHSEIREVILSGGDPLNLSENQLDYLLTELKNISHVNSIRIHTRYPVTLPQRITPALCNVLQKHFPIFVVTHFNHAKEITNESQKAIQNLIQIGNCAVFNQGVLLSGVNDTVDDLKDLFYNLLRIGVKPYYLHQCDEVFGSSGFKVPISKGIELMKQVRGYISGLAVPNYVIDLTGGGGKIPLVPNYLQNETDETYEFQNYRGKNYIVGK